ncbi:MAG: hypothetical protein MI975_22920 [Cytophagales bacterium]|nr:hypothetical protein [Cytophagales bacterium]
MVEEYGQTVEIRNKHERMIGMIEKLKSDNLPVLLDQAAFSGSNFIVTLMLARILAPDQFGIFSSVVLFVYLLISISNALIVQPFQVILPSVKEQSDYRSFATAGQTLVIVATAALTWLLMRFRADILIGLRSESTGIISYIAAFLYHDFHRKIFLARGAVGQALVIDTVTGVVQISGLAVGHYMAAPGLSQVLTFMGISYVPSLFISIFVSGISLRGCKKWPIYYLMHVRQGKWLLMTSVLQWWANNLFTVVSGIFLGAKALGALRLVQSFFGVLNMLIQTFENYALPRAAHLFQTSAEESKLYLRKISLHGILLSGIFLCVIFLFSNEIIVLASGHAYSEYAYLVNGMAVLYVIIFLGYPVRMAIRIMVLNRQFFTGYVVSFLFSLFSFRYLLIEWQLRGALAGLVLNQLIILVFWQYALIKKNFVLWK